MEAKIKKVVAFLFYPGDEYSQHVCYGINEETESQTQWDFGLVWERAGMSMSDRIGASNGARFDGLIADIRNTPVLEEIRAAGVPLVSVSMKPPPTGIPFVMPDLHAIGTMAADHFLDLHLRHLGIVVSDAHSPMVKGFASAVAARGGESPRVYVFPHANDVDKRVFSGPVPIGILCESDRYARQLADLAVSNGVRVPDDLAILGVGNNRMLCGSSPRISSIELPLEQIGVEAAKFLHRLLRGKTVRSHHLLPVRVVSRESTRVFGVEDNVVRNALLYMQDNLGSDVTIPNAAVAVDVSQRTLEYRFRQAIGCSIREALLRLRIRYAKDRLLATSEAVKVVAIDAGYTRLSSFIRMFRSQTGLSPTQYRATHGAQARPQHSRRLA